MKPKTFGILIIILGVIMMVYTGFNFVTTKKVVDLGPLQINQEKNYHVQWPPVVGSVLIIGGIAIMMFGKKSPVINA